MLKWTSTGLSLIFLLFSLQGAMASGPEELKPELIQVWETDALLDVPESVLHVKTGDFFFVSNISGNPDEKDGIGFISKVSMKGEILELEWATGLNAPKGMAIYSGHLYVSDIDRLVQIALATGEIVAEYPAPGAVFLNDVAADCAGNIYVSDSSSSNSAIYRLVEGAINVWMSNEQILKPNGLHMKYNKLLVGSSGDGCIKSIDLETKEIKVVTCPGSGIDGLHPVKKGVYVISDWKGKTSLVTNDGDLTVLLDTTDLNINSADLDYVRKKKILLIPTFFDNRVVAYKLKLHKN